MNEIDVGQVIAGKYELVRLVGKGAMGEVWSATHNTLGGDFAIKLVWPSDDIEDETAAGRFQLEAQVSAKLSRKTRHIVSVSDHGEENGLAYLVMELLEGESLEARLKSRGALSVPETVAMVMQIARALGIAHAEGIFHRDLKPANVFLTQDEDGRLLVKLLDFGIARVGPGGKPMRTRSPFATGKDMVLGTPSYMSPEQARGLDTLDYRCDLWALAVVAYEALTHKIPWQGTTVEDIFLSICTYRVLPILSARPDLPPGTEEFFARAFASKLDERYTQASELSEAFEILATPDDVEAALGGRSPSFGSSSRRFPAAAGSSPSIRRDTPTLSEMRSDPIGVSVGEPTVHTKRRRALGSWSWGIAAGIATILVILVGILAFGSRKAAPPSTSTPPSSETNVTATANMTAPVVPSTPVIVAEPSSTSTNEPSGSATPAPSPIGKRPSVKPVAVVPATKPSAQRPPVSTPPPPPSAPASASKKPHEKGEVL